MSDDQQPTWDRATLDAFVADRTGLGSSLDTIRDQVGALLAQLDAGWAWQEVETLRARREIARLERSMPEGCTALAEWRERDMTLAAVRVQVYGATENAPEVELTEDETPADHETICPSCGATIRARLADAPAEGDPLKGRTPQALAQAAHEAASRLNDELSNRWHSALALPQLDAVVVDMATVVDWVLFGATRFLGSIDLAPLHRLLKHHNDAGKRGLTHTTTDAGLESVLEEALYSPLIKAKLDNREGS